MKKFVLVTLCFLVLLVLVSAWKVLGPTLSTPHGEFFYVKTGERYEGVRDSLVRQRYLGGSWWFDRVARMVGYTPDRVRAGRYKITKGMSLLQLVRMLKNGRQTPVNLVITKLRTKEDFAHRIGSQFECDSAQMMAFLTNPDTLARYGLDSNTVMTALLPDTYTYFWNSTPTRIFTKIFEASQRFWTPERREQATRLGLTPQQAYILASILEEESNDPHDKPLIASVYLNRLAKGMPLQADPTIKFAMRNFGLHRIYTKYLAVESPYNTYRNKGLPPGPICTPSARTLDAVLTAPQTNYLYFVANSDLSGKHVFTSDYQEHLKYARQYQQVLDRLDSARQANQAAP
ncbi:MAG TPA: endolytic transglycosylase MltG [Chitinophagaceae bacterium]|nr:endolytic transglycosylase MltG [Chitinophagaceae bacterium]